MFAAPPGTYSLHTSPFGHGDQPMRQPVIAWTDDGEAMIIHGDRLRPAKEVDGFVGLAGSLDWRFPRLVSLTPAPDWVYLERDADGRIAAQTPLVGFGVFDDGSIRPVTVSEVDEQIRILPEDADAEIAHIGPRRDDQHGAQS